jgi:hypothetical protein
MIANSDELADMACTGWIMVVAESPLTTRYGISEAAMKFPWSERSYWLRTRCVKIGDKSLTFSMQNSLCPKL